MGRRRRRRAKADPRPEPELAGIAKLLSEIPVATLDVHGLTADQALRRVRDFLETHRRVSPGRVVHLVTGRGNRSEGPAVLRSSVRELLDRELSHLVAESAGALGGGAWVVRLR